MASDPTRPDAAPSPHLLCLHGSPRLGGNTDILLNVVAEAAAEAGLAVEHLHCRDLTLRPCTGCGACAATGECVIEGDDMEIVHRALDAASAMVVGAPVYFLGVPASFKVLIDRHQPRWSRRYLLERDPGPERPGAFVSTAGAPSHSVFTCAQSTIVALFDVLGVTCRANLLYENVDQKGAIRSHPTALEDARAAGTTLANLVRTNTS